MSRLQMYSLRQQLPQAHTATSSRERSEADIDIAIPEYELRSKLPTASRTLGTKCDIEACKGLLASPSFHGSFTSNARLSLQPKGILLLGMEVSLFLRLSSKVCIYDVCSVFQAPCYL